MGAYVLRILGPVCWIRVVLGRPLERRFRDTYDDETLLAIDDDPVEASEVLLRDDLVLERPSSLPTGRELPVWKIPLANSGPPATSSWAELFGTDPDEPVQEPAGRIASRAGIGFNPGGATERTGVASMEARVWSDIFSPTHQTKSCMHLLHTHCLLTLSMHRHTRPHHMITPHTARGTALARMTDENRIVHSVLENITP